MSSKKIVLTSSDGEFFEVEEVVARKLQIVRHMIEDDCVINEIPLQNVTGKTLAMVIEYCKKHVDDVADEDESEEAKKKKAEEEKDEAEKEETWDKEFMKNFDVPTIFQLILAANYLSVQGLLDLACQTVADQIKDYTVEEIRELFNVENDYTAEEEAKVREEYAWAFESDPKP